MKKSVPSNEGQKGRPAAGEAEVSFEEAYRRLEEIVRKLETGGLPLEESVGLFEQGMILARLCGQKLDAAELRITQIGSEEPPDGPEGP